MFQTLKNKPEIYLVLATLYYWFLTSTLINPVAIVLLIVLGAQMVFQNKLFGNFLGISLFLLNVYMVFALISELLEFEAFNVAAFNMLLFGSLFFGLNLFFSVRMFKVSN